MYSDDEPDHGIVQVPCASHLIFSILANQTRRNMAFMSSHFDTEDPCCDALLAGDELAAIALGADPAFVTVSSGKSSPIIHGRKSVSTGRPGTMQLPILCPNAQA
jgi:hypothetical protein